MSAEFEAARGFFQAGLKCFAAGEWEQAEVQFRASLALLPGRASTLTNLGATLIKRGRPQDALDLLEQALAVAPDDSEALAHQGLAHADLGQASQALACFDRVLARDPQQRAARTQRAHALNRLQRYGEALGEVDHLLASTPGDAALWLEHARTLHRLERIGPALQSYQRAIDADAALAPAWSERGGLLKDLGRLAEAAACFERALALGADAELNAYYLAAVTGAQAPSAPPARYVEQLFDGYADQFDAHLQGQLHYQAPQVLAQHLQGLEQERFRRALDLGCGTGLCGPLFAPWVDRLDGVDLSSAMLAKARHGGHYGDLVQADLAAYLAATDRSYDLVLATDTFIYVGALDAVYAGVRRVLEAGGVFCFSVELTDDDVDFVLRPSSRYAHSRRYVDALAQRHGFTVTSLHEQTLRRDQTRSVRGLYAYLSVPPMDAAHHAQPGSGRAGQPTA